MPDDNLKTIAQLGRDFLAMHARIPEADRDAWFAENERRQAEYEQHERQRRLESERGARRDALSREHVPLRESVETAIVNAEPMQETKAMLAVQRWMGRADVSPVLILSGATGCGKTVAAAWALAQRGGRWRTAAQICRIFAAQFGEQYEEQETLLRCPLLVIDDLGSEMDYSRMSATLLELLDQRQHSARRYRTIITTNLDRRTFGERYADPRIMSRTHSASGIVTWVGSQEADMRRGGK